MVLSHYSYLYNQWHPSRQAARCSTYCTLWQTSFKVSIPPKHAHNKGEVSPATFSPFTLLSHCFLIPLISPLLTLFISTNAGSGQPSINIHLLACGFAWRRWYADKGTALNHPAWFLSGATQSHYPKHWDAQEAARRLQWSPSITRCLSGELAPACQPIINRKMWQRTDVVLYLDAFRSVFQPFYCMSCSIWSDNWLCYSFIIQTPAGSACRRVSSALYNGDQSVAQRGTFQHDTTLMLVRYHILQSRGSEVVLRLE